MLLSSKPSSGHHHRPHFYCCSRTPPFDLPLYFRFIFFLRNAHTHPQHTCTQICPDVVTMIDQSTNRPRGFGFISFDTEDAFDRVLQKTFHELNNKLVEVKEVLPKDANPGGGGGRGYQDSQMDGNRFIQQQTPGGGGYPVNSGYGQPSYGFGGGYGSYGVGGYGGVNGAYGGGQGVSAQMGQFLTHHCHPTSAAFPSINNQLLHQVATGDCVPPLSLLLDTFFFFLAAYSVLRSGRTQGMMVFGVVCHGRRG